MFFDGALLESDAGGAAISVTGTSGSRIGGDAGAGATTPLQGAIDEVRVWRVARTDDQICKAAGTC